MKYILLFLITFLFPLSTQSQDHAPVAKKIKKGQPEVYSINLYTSYQKSISSLPLSRFTEDIEYIPLETTDDCLLDEELKIISVTEKEIIVFDYTRAYRFSRQGKFLNSIARKGQGPGEFSNCISLAADTLNRWLYFADNNRLLKYDFDGNHLEDLAMGFWTTVMLINKPDELIMENFNYPYAEAGKRFSVFNYNPLEKKFAAKVACEKRDRIPLALIAPVFYSYKGEVYVKDYWEDVLYRSVSSTRLETYMVFEKGKFIERDEDDHSLYTGKATPNANRIIAVQSMAESDRYIFLFTSQGNIVFDKKSKETTMVNYSDTEHALLNDLYGSPNFAPGYGFPGLTVGNTMYGFCPPHILINNKNRKHSVTGKKYDEYQKRVNSLDPEGNQVIVVLKLKK